MKHTLAVAFALLISCNETSNNSQLLKYENTDGNICILERKYTTLTQPLIEAIEKELARTIETLGEVDQAIVIINIPEKPLFTEEKPNARVIVKLHKDKNLQERQVKNIQHLVANAIEDNILKPRQVVVVDANGNQISNDLEQEKGTFTDQRDGKTYKTTKMGKKVWLAENLNYAAKGSKCGSEKKISRRERDSIYDYNRSKGRIVDIWPDYLLKDENTEFCDKYGRLYNWETALKVCPEGWHLPTFGEWDELIEAGGLSISANGTDKYDFAALSGGNGHYNEFQPDDSHWWSSTEYEVFKAHKLIVLNKYSGINWTTENKLFFNSVRCVKNSNHSSSTIGEKR